MVNYKSADAKLTPADKWAFRISMGALAVAGRWQKQERRSTNLVRFGGIYAIDTAGLIELKWTDVG